MEKTFYICEHCGNLVELIYASGAKMICCGNVMTDLTPKTKDLGHEKHTPIISVIENKVIVEVSSVPHPMLPNHFIQWICLETDKGIYRKNLNYGENAIAEFILNDEKPIAAYSYCNIHGLWKNQI